MTKIFPVVVVFISSPINSSFSSALDSSVLSSFRTWYTRDFVYGVWRALERHIFAKWLFP